MRAVQVHDSEGVDIVTGVPGFSDSRHEPLFVAAYLARSRPVFRFRIRWQLHFLEPGIKLRLRRSY